MSFVRVQNSQKGVFDIGSGEVGQVLVSNGPDVAPSFQDLPAGAALRGFSYTQAWEKEILDRVGGYDFGLANFTAEFERTMITGPTRHGPANYTNQSDRPWALRV